MRSVPMDSLYDPGKAASDSLGGSGSGSLGDSYAGVLIFGKTVHRRKLQGGSNSHHVN